MPITLCLNYTTSNYMSKGVAKPMEENKVVSTNAEGIEQLIIVRQLPVIEAQLREKAADIKARTEVACSMACTPDTLATVKNMRAELNKEFKQYEAARKRVKTAIMAPYEDFEATYKECIADAFTNADKQLGLMVNSVSYHLREEKERGIREYFYNHLEAAGLERDKFAYERMGLAVTLSKSDTSLKKECKAWIEQRNQDLTTISGMNNADEIMVEYLRTLDLSRSILVVNDRHHELDSIRTQRAEKEQAEGEKVSEPVEVKVPENNALSAPEVVQAMVETGEPELKLVFTVYGTREKLKELKAFLVNGGYRYE